MARAIQKNVQNTNILFLKWYKLYDTDITAVNVARSLGTQLLIMFAQALPRCFANWWQSHHLLYDLLWTQS